MKPRGFTLLEILIVIVIISIISAIAVLTISSNQNKNIENFANDFADVLNLAEEEAILRPAILGLLITPQYFEFYEYHEVDPNNKDKKPWQPLNEKILGKHSIPNYLKLKLKIQNESVELTNNSEQKPQIFITANGEITPFVMLFGKKRGDPLVQVNAATNGAIKSARYQENE